MGHFSNSTEYAMWVRDNCDRCRHQSDDGCPVIVIHNLYGYAPSDKISHILDMLIPNEGGENGQCRMFIEDQKAETKCA
jgi:hypothetical protein